MALSYQNNHIKTNMLVFIQPISQRAVPANVWLGVSVENRRYGLPRIEHGRQVPARVRFLSVEPWLEDLVPLDLDGMHWVIVGGESGPEARPMRLE